MAPNHFIKPDIGFNLLSKINFFLNDSNSTNGPFLTGHKKTITPVKA